MQLQGIRADPAQVERLQFMLSEKNSEIETLMKKVQQLEKVEVRFCISQWIWCFVLTYIVWIYLIQFIISEN